MRSERELSSSGSNSAVRSGIVGVCLHLESVAVQTLTNFKNHDIMIPALTARCRLCLWGGVWCQRAKHVYGTFYWDRASSVALCDACAACFLHSTAILHYLPQDTSSSKTAVRVSRVLIYILYI